VRNLQSQIESILEPLGFEVHPFLIGWYNEQVSPKFHLDYPSRTLAFIVISRPSMFEDAFLPFLKSHLRTGLHDPIDECMLHCFSKVKDVFPSVATLHDFQLLPSRRPKVLVQTAGHVSGAVRFFRPEDYTVFSGKKFYPVCHHPCWGGWFALRGVIIFENTESVLDKKEPPYSLTESEAIEMIKLYNECWQDWRWRDVGRNDSNRHLRYSSVQMKYFETSPDKRLPLIENLMKEEEE